MKLRLTLAAAVSLLAAAPPALAQFPGKAFTITNDTNAEHPEVAVDAGGTGHVVWEEDVPNGADVLHYCRVPRGATACQGHREFVPIDGEGSARPRVVTPAPGRVILLTHRIARRFIEVPGGPTLDLLFAYDSTDGGATFAAPKMIGTLAPSEDAVFGPGDFQVSVLEGRTQGMFFQAAPLNGFSYAKANLSSFLQSFSGSVGLLDPTTPLVAWTDYDKIFYRAWGGVGDPNNAATWGPVHSEIGAGDEPKLAYGPRGAYLMYRAGPSGRPRYYVRRFEAGVPGAPTQISESIGTHLWRDFVQTRGGHLIAVWMTNGGAAGQEDPIKYRASTDGKTWGPIRILIPETANTGFHPQVDAAPDGGGFVVWDNNAKGPIRAVAIPKLGAGTGGGGGGADCVPSVAFEKVEALAKVGCFAHSGGTYTANVDVRMNGLDLVPKPGAKIVVVPGKRQISAVGEVTVKVGNVVLHRGPFTWTVPPGAEAGVATFGDVGKFGVSLLGFPVVGEAQLVLTAKGAKVPVNFALPPYFGGVTGVAVLHADNATPLGLKLESLTIDVPTAFLGTLLVKDLRVSYSDAPDVFEGSARFLLPPAYAEPGIKVAFGFKNGKFAHAEGSVNPITPPLPLAPPWAFINGIGLAFATDPVLKIAGGVNLVAGPTIAGKAVLAVNAMPPQHGFSFTFGDPTVLKASASLSVVEIPIGAGGFVEYKTTGLLTFGGSIVDYKLPLSIASFKGGIPATSPGPGQIDLTTGKFNAGGSGEACIPAGCIGAKLVVSSKGVAACGELVISEKPKVGVSAGFGYKWGSSPDVFGDLGGCSLGPYKQSVGASWLRALSSFSSIPLRRGLPQAAIVVEGTTDAPRVQVTAPNGERIASPDDPAGVVRTSHMLLFANRASRRTHVLIGRPPAGAYVVTALPGSSPLKGVRVAEGLPQPSVSARVTGRGRARAVAYRLRTIRGQVVTFFERSASVGRALGQTARARGTLRFTPADGPAGRRSIVALVEQDGIPRSEIPVARYVAPAPLGPAKPRGVRLVRTGRTLVLRWARSRNAVRYEARVRLSDGRRLLFLTGVPSVRVPGVRANVGARATVRGVKADGTRGPQAAIQLAAKKRRR